MASLMDFAIGRLDANGRPHDGPGDWMFIDWAPETLHNTGGVTSFEQMLLVEALETLAEVSETIGRGDLTRSSRATRTCSASHVATSTTRSANPC